MTYETIVGLHLNINRIRWQRVHEVSQAIAVANSNEDMPDEYFDAMASYKSQVEDMKARENLKRMEARLMEEARRNPRGW